MFFCWLKGVPETVDLHVSLKSANKNAFLILRLVFSLFLCLVVVFSSFSFSVSVLFFFVICLLCGDNAFEA